MTESYTITVEWSAWLDPDFMDEEWSDSGVLYLYGDDDRPYYIGEAFRQTVKERFDDHQNDGVLECVSNRTEKKFGVKVGHIVKGVSRLSRELLHDIQTLLIFDEADGDNCECNRANTESRNDKRPGMVILNAGDYTPLALRYTDDDI